MDEIWKNRRATYQKMLLKYLRYVFNDHFVIALLFLFGAFGLTYSNFLKSLQGDQNLWWAKPTALLILLLSLHLNHLATFLKEPDRVFLLPQEAAMPAYIKKSLTHSQTVMFIVQAVIYLLLTPFLLFAAKLSVVNVGCLLVVQLLLVLVLSNHQAVSLFVPAYRQAGYRGLVVWLMPAVILALGVYLPAYLAVILAVAAVIWQNQHDKVSMKGRLFDWRFALDHEQSRTTRLFRFFNLFTDVKSVTPKPKRRRYLDRFLPKASQKPAGIFTYMYWRAFIRSGQYSSLYLRLTALGMLMLFFIPNFWLALIIAALFLYMLGFQLLPLFVVYDEVVFMHTYPIDSQKKFLAFAKVLFSLLLLSALLFVIPLAIQLHDPLKVMAAGALLLLESGFLARIYSKGRLKKIS